MGAPDGGRIGGEVEVGNASSAEISVPPPDPVASDIDGLQCKRCYMKGDCDKYPQHVRDVGARLSSVIGSTLRQPRSSAQQAQPPPGSSGGDGGEPPLPLEGEAEPSPITMVQVWAIQVGTANHYFLVAHMLLNPYRIIVIPLRFVDLPAEARIASAQAVAVIDWGQAHDNCPWPFQTLYEFVHCAFPNDDIGVSRTSVNLYDLCPVDWDALIIKRPRSSWTPWSARRPRSKLEEDLLAQQRALRSLQTSLSQGRGRGGGPGRGQGLGQGRGQGGARGRAHPAGRRGRSGPAALEDGDPGSAPAVAGGGGKMLCFGLMSFEPISP